MLLRESNLWLLLVFVFTNPRNITIQGICNSNKFWWVYTLIFENRFIVQFKCQKYIYCSHGIASLFQKQHNSIKASVCQATDIMSHPMPLLIADPIYEKKVFLISLAQNFTKNFDCGTHFQFRNHDSFEKVNWS